MSISSCFKDLSCGSNLNNTLEEIDKVVKAAKNDLWHVVNDTVNLNLLKIMEQITEHYSDINTSNASVECEQDADNVKAKPTICNAQNNQKYDADIFDLYSEPLESFMEKDHSFCPKKLPNKMKKKIHSICNRPPYSPRSTSARNNPKKSLVELENEHKPNSNESHIWHKAPVFDTRVARRNFINTLDVPINHTTDILVVLDTTKPLTSHKYPCNKPSFKRSEGLKTFKQVKVIKELVENKRRINITDDCIELMDSKLIQELNREYRKIVNEQSFFNSPNRRIITSCISGENSSYASSVNNDDSGRVQDENSFLQNNQQQSWSLLNISDAENSSNLQHEFPFIIPLANQVNIGNLPEYSNTDLIENQLNSLSEDFKQSLPFQPPFTLNNETLDNSLENTKNDVNHFIGDKFWNDGLNVKGVSKITQTGSNYNLFCEGKVNLEINDNAKFIDGVQVFPQGNYTNEITDSCNFNYFASIFKTNQTQLHNDNIVNIVEIVGKTPLETRSESLLSGDLKMIKSCETTEENQALDNDLFICLDKNEIVEIDDSLDKKDCNHYFVTDAKPESQNDDYICDENNIQSPTLHASNSNKVIHSDTVSVKDSGDINLALDQNDDTSFFSFIESSQTFLLENSISAILNGSSQDEVLFENSNSTPPTSNNKPLIKNSNSPSLTDSDHFSIDVLSPLNQNDETLIENVNLTSPTYSDIFASQNDVALLKNDDPLIKNDESLIENNVLLIGNFNSTPPTSNNISTRVFIPLRQNDEEPHIKNPSLTSLTDSDHFSIDILSPLNQNDESLLESDNSLFEGNERGNEALIENTNSTSLINSGIFATDFQPLSSQNDESLIKNDELLIKNTNGISLIGNFSTGFLPTPRQNCESPFKYDNPLIETTDSTTPTVDIFATDFFPPPSQSDKLIMVKDDELHTENTNTTSLINLDNFSTYFRQPISQNDESVIKNGESLKENTNWTCLINLDNFPTDFLPPTSQNDETVIENEESLIINDVSLIKNVGSLKENTNWTSPINLDNHSTEFLPPTNSVNKNDESVIKNDVSLIKTDESLINNYGSLKENTNWSCLINFDNRSPHFFPPTNQNDESVNKNDESLIKNDDSLVKNDGSLKENTNWTSKTNLDNFSTDFLLACQNDESVINNDESLVIKNGESWVKNASSTFLKTVDNSPTDFLPPLCGNLKHNSLGSTLKDCFVKLERCDITKSVCHSNFFKPLLDLPKISSEIGGRLGPFTIKVSSPSTLPIKFNKPSTIIAYNQSKNCTITSGELDNDDVNENILTNNNLTELKGNTSTISNQNLANETINDTRNVIANDIKGLTTISAVSNNKSDELVLPVKTVIVRDKRVKTLNKFSTPTIPINNSSSVPPVKKHKAIIDSWIKENVKQPITDSKHSACVKTHGTLILTESTYSNINNNTKKENKPQKTSGLKRAAPIHTEIPALIKRQKPAAKVNDDDYIDAAEIADNNDPRWNLYKFNEPSACFQAVCNQWSFEPPNPHINLTRRFCNRPRPITPLGSEMNDPVCNLQDSKQIDCLSVYADEIHNINIEVQRLKSDLNMNGQYWPKSRVNKCLNEIDSLNNMHEKLRVAWDDSFQFFTYYINRTTGQNERFITESRKQELTNVRQLLKSYTAFYGYSE